MNREKARKNLKKYKLIARLLALAFMLICVFLAIFCRNLLYMIALLLLFKFLSIRLEKKYILDPISKDLDAPLFHEIVEQGKFSSPSAITRLNAEYYVGEYNNVLSVCNRKLCDPKISKKHKYVYYAFLATIYFDIGDNESLADICAKFDNELSKESVRRAKKIRARFPKIELCKNYLNGNYDACYSYAYKQAAVPIDQVRNTYYKARIALCKNDKEDAERFFKAIIEKAPNTGYADLSKHGIEAIEKDISYKDTFEALTPNDSFVIDPPTKLNKFSSMLRKVAATLLIGCVALYCVLWIITAVNKLNSDGGHAEHEGESERFRERVRLLVEEEYDEVEILDTFVLNDKNRIVDSLFVSRTEDRIIVGSLFTASGKGDMFFEVRYDLPYSNLDKFKRWYFSFYCLVREYYAECAFFANEEEVPDSYFYLTEVKVNEKTLYLVVLEVTESSQQ